MFSCNDKISLRQLKILFILNLFSTTSLILPRMVAESAGKDGWISIILGTILAGVYVFVISRLTTRFPKETFLEFGNRLIGKILTKLLGILLGVKLIIFAAFGVRLFSELIKETLLNNTPLEVIIISMLLLVTYAARKGYECRARVAEIVIWIVFIPLVLVMVFALPQVEIKEVMPLFTTSVSNIFQGAFIVSLSYSAIEFLLLATPYTNKPKRILKPAMFSLVFVGVVNVVICIITFGVLGVVGTRRQIWPVMNIMQVTNIPGLFVERQDALMISFWIISMFAVLSGYVFFISVLTQRLFKLKEQNFLVLPFLPIIYLIALIPDNIVQAYDLVVTFMTYFGLVFLLVIPCILLVIAKLKREGETIEVE